MYRITPGAQRARFYFSEEPCVSVLPSRRI